MKQAKTLTDAELKKVIAFCHSRKYALRDQTMLYVSFYAGLRVMEIAGLLVGDVYDEQAQVRDRFLITGSQTKGGYAREVYVNRKLKRALENYQPVIEDRTQDQPLFCTQLGTAFSANSLCQLFLKLYADCGIKGASSHSGRRTFITKLANTGVNVRLLAALAGHRHISTTQRYIDVNDAQLASAVELI